jgi:hypothetical protein
MNPTSLDWSRARNRTALDPMFGARGSAHRTRTAIRLMNRWQKENFVHTERDGFVVGTESLRALAED